MESMADHWNKQAEGHDEKFIGELGMTAFYDEVERQLFKCPCKSNILVLGCGTGLEIERIKFKANVTAIDISEKMLEELGKKELYSGISLNIICGSFLEIDFENNAYDIVLSCLAMHHFDEDQKTLLYEKIYKSLSKRGIFLNGDTMEETREGEIRRFEDAKKIYDEKNLSFGSLHIDVPFCFEHDEKILKAVGFRDMIIEREWDTVKLYRAIK